MNNKNISAFKFCHQSKSCPPTPLYVHPILSDHRLFIFSLYSFHNHFFSNQFSYPNLLGIFSHCPSKIRSSPQLCFPRQMTTLSPCLLATGTNSTGDRLSERSSIQCLWPQVKLDVFDLKTQFRRKIRIN